MLFAKSSQPSGGTSPSLPTLLFYLPPSFISAALGVLCYRDFTSCIRRVSVSHFQLFCFHPSPSSQIVHQGSKSLSFQRYRFLGMDANNFSSRPLLSSSIGFDPCHEITSPHFAQLPPTPLSPSRFSSATSRFPEKGIAASSESRREVLADLLERPSWFYN